MNKFAIKNKEELKRFETLLDAYWMDYSSSEEQTKEIYQYYLQKENLPLIDNRRNNPRALALCLSHSYEDFLDKLLFSEEIKTKSYSLTDISHTLSKNQQTEIDSVFKIIKSIETTPEIFDDFRLKTKKIFMDCILSYFIGNENFLENNSDYFFNFIKKNKINIYDNQYEIIDKLIFKDRIETLNLIIEKTKKDSDKEKIVNFNTEDMEISYEIDSWFKEQRQNLAIMKNYKELNTNLNSQNIKTKKMKI